MFHGNTALKVSVDEASRAEDEAKRRLLSNKKLSLVVDLDQTIIHATVDPTVAEWQSDKNNPNYEAVKHVQAFQLADEGGGPRTACWYYIKLRPGTEAFFEEIGKLFECHIYTMGTRAYAQNVAKIIDPERKIFGDRILSRDESGSLVAKNLQRLFPVDTKMVVIMDDRADVWKWSPNLIRLPAYDFFVGIGDINASFLPKRPDSDIPPPPKVEKLEDAPAAENTQNGQEASGAEHGVTAEAIQAQDPASLSQTPAVASTNGDVSTLDQLVSMGGGDDVEAMKEKTLQQDETIAAQLADRPLLQKQKMLDEEDAKATQQNGDSSPDDDPNPETGHRHHLLQDDDEELIRLEAALRKVHAEFYAEYERRKLSSQGGRIADLKGARNPKSSPKDELLLVPDVKAIMPPMKQQTLHGVNLVFTGIMPIGVDVHM
jgi:RNA polymerase II subunit A C-terminal domain phosphatase